MLHREVKQLTQSLTANKCQIGDFHIGNVVEVSHSLTSRLQCCMLSHFNFFPRFEYSLPQYI